MEAQGGYLGDGSAKLSGGVNPINLHGHPLPLLSFIHFFLHGHLWGHVPFPFFLIIFFFIFHHICFQILTLKVFLFRSQKSYF